MRDVVNKKLFYRDKSFNRNPDGIFIHEKTKTTNNQDHTAYQPRHQKKIRALCICSFVFFVWFVDGYFQV